MSEKIVQAPGLPEIRAGERLADRRRIFGKRSSGFKLPANSREALLAIKQATILKKFGVLLVFMFGRFGRRDDKTPLRQGAWSVTSPEVMVRFR